MATAAFWAADAGHRVAHTTVHVHGGVGIDIDHPVHRYFLAAKQTEFAFGGATGQLLLHRPRAGGHARSDHVSDMGSPIHRWTPDRPSMIYCRPLVDITDRGLYDCAIGLSDAQVGPADLISWGDHITAGAQLAAALTARLDPAEPPHVGVLLGNTPFFSSVLVAAAMAGSVPVGLNPTRRGAALVGDIVRSDCQLVLADNPDLVPSGLSDAGSMSSTSNPIPGRPNWPDSPVHRSSSSTPAPTTCSC